MKTMVMHDYNSKSDWQGSLVKSCLDMFAKAIETIKINENYINTLDSGCSNGKNALLFTSKIREKFPKKIINSYFNDLPDNNFSYIFHELNQADIYPYSIGRSFTKRLAQESFFDFAYISTALHWIEALPKLETGFEIHWQTMDKKNKDILRQYSMEGLGNYFKNRALELKKGAKLIIMQPHPDLSNSAVYYFDIFKRSLKKMHDDKIITFESLNHFFFPTFDISEELVLEVLNVNKLKFDVEYSSFDPEYDFMLKQFSGVNKDVFANMLFEFVMAFSKNLIENNLIDENKISKEDFFKVLKLNFTEICLADIDSYKNRKVYVTKMVLVNAK